MNPLQIHQSSVIPSYEPTPFLESARYADLICGNATMEMAQETLSRPPADPERRQWAIDNAKTLVLKYCLYPLPEWMGFPPESFKITIMLSDPSILHNELFANTPDPLLIEALRGEPSRDMAGQTIFHYACKWEHPNKYQLIEKLIILSWNSYVADAEGNFPFDFLQKSDANSLIPVLFKTECPRLTEGEAHWLGVLCLLKNPFWTSYYARMNFMTNQITIIKDLSHETIYYITRACHNPMFMEELVVYLNNPNLSQHDLNVRISHVVTFIDNIFKDNEEDKKRFYKNGIHHLITGCLDLETSNSLEISFLQTLGLIPAVIIYGNDEDLKHLENRIELLYERGILSRDQTHIAAFCYYYYASENSISTIRDTITKLLKNTYTIRMFNFDYYKHKKTNIKIKYLEIILPVIPEADKPYFIDSHIKFCDPELNLFLLSTGHTEISIHLDGILMFTDEWLQIIITWLAVGGKLKNLRIDEKIDITAGNLKNFIPNTHIILERFPFCSDYFEVMFNLLIKTSGFIEHNQTEQLIEIYKNFKTKLNYQDLLYNHSKTPNKYRIFKALGVFIPNRYYRHEFSNDALQTFKIISPDEKTITTTVHQVFFETSLISSSGRRNVKIQISATKGDISVKTAGYFTEEGYRIFLSNFAKAILENTKPKISNDTTLRYVRLISRFNSRRSINPLDNYKNPTRNKLPIHFCFYKIVETFFLKINHFDYQSQKIMTFLAPYRPFVIAGVIFDIKKTLTSFLQQYYLTNKKHIESFQKDLKEVVPSSEGNPASIAIEVENDVIWLEAAIAKNLQRPVTLDSIGGQTFHEKELLDMLKEDPESSDDLTVLESIKHERELKLKNEQAIHNALWNAYEEAINTPANSSTEISEPHSRKRVWIFDQSGSSNLQRVHNPIEGTMTNRPKGVDIILKRIEQDPKIQHILEQQRLVRESEQAIYNYLTLLAVSRR